jgi:peptidoglycan hydrolase-like protein with peptidoglycan-binding domain
MWSRTGNGFFGPATEQALGSFYRDFEVAGDGKSLTESGSVFLQAFLERKDAKAPVATVVENASSAAAITQAKRTLRFLDYYDGRTNGNFDERLFAAILKFQQRDGSAPRRAQPSSPFGTGNSLPNARRRSSSSVASINYSRSEMI